MDRTQERNVINNMLAEMYGYEESIPLRTVVESSPRYGSLLAIAGWAPNQKQMERLAKALPKLIKNPKTKAVV
jgi:hypothetical protein